MCGASIQGHKAGPSLSPAGGWGEPRVLHQEFPED